RIGCALQSEGRRSERAPPFLIAALRAARDQRKRALSCPQLVELTGVGFTESMRITRSSKSLSPGAPASGSSQHSHQLPVFTPVPLNVIARAKPPGLRPSCVNTVPTLVDR